MKNVQKKLLVIVCIVAVLITALGSRMIIYAGSEADETETTMATEIELALSWILKSVGEDGSFGDNSLINDMAEVRKLFMDMGRSLDTEWLTENAALWQDNNDSLARLYSATGDAGYIELILEAQNGDGGFGLTADYTSDVWDSALVYEALVRSHISGRANQEEISRLVSYLVEMQNDDGSYSCIQGADADYELTACIAIITKYLMNNSDITCDEAWLAEMEKYLMKEQSGFEEDFVNAAYQRIYMCLTGLVTDTREIEAELASLQCEDGSFMGNLKSTIAAIRLMQAVEEFNRPYIDFDGMITELSSYVLYDGFEKEITVKSNIGYKTNSQFDGKWVVEVMCDGEPIILAEEMVGFDKTKENLYLEKLIRVTGQSDKKYTIITRLVVEDEVVFSVADELTVSQPYVDELVLTGMYTPDGEVSLSWNDISNEFYKFGYRLLRSTNGGEWESVSLWNGEEKVKVLNIYPIVYAKNNLIDWMNTSVEGGEPAGKGLFEIDTVDIGTYNRVPYDYLLDESGNFKYDVLYFGAYDTNAGYDLSDVSYEATQEFVDSGRGVLFGHDTVSLGSTAYHTRFARFADQLGIKLKTYGEIVRSDKVRIVKEGLLTGYPWKIEGVLTIPATHSFHQYTGGTMTATVWMELVNGGLMDEETGSCANAYLFSKNQLAMIQTGDQNGAATDDERKVMANTLFYLKQLSNATGTVDKSAYDMAVPQICKAGEIVREGRQVYFEVNAVDYGTDYQYYVEALKAKESAGEKSNVVNINVTSGIKGYAISIIDSADAGADMSQAEVLVPEDGVLTVNLADLEEDGQYYIHIRAVDNAGNMSEELVLAVPTETKEEPAGGDCFGTGYSLFASEDITVYCSELGAAGNVYSGGNFTFGGSVLTVSSLLETVGNINAWAGNVNVTDWLEQVPAKEMPALHESIVAVMGSAEEMEVLDAYNSTQVDVPTYCMTTTGAYCPELVINESLVCEGTINVGAGNVALGQEKNIVLYSVNEDININASTLSGCGLIHAPNGTVTINVQNLAFTGSIIAKKIVIQGLVINID